MSVVVITVSLLGLCCTPDDDDRCGKKYVWDGESCVLKPEDNPDDSDDGQTDDEMLDAAPSADGGGDGDSETAVQIPSGLGMSCTQDGEECSGFEASFCTANPAVADGYCTIEGCTKAEANCPEGYSCCEMTIGSPPAKFCATHEDIATMLEYSLCL